MASAGRTDASAAQKTPAKTDKPPHKAAVRALSKTVRLRDKEHRKPCSATGFRTSTRTSFRATPTTRARAGPSRSRSRDRGRCRRDASRGTWSRCVRHWRSDRCVDRCSSSTSRPATRPTTGKALGGVWVSHVPGAASTGRRDAGCCRSCSFLCRMWGWREATRAFGGGRCVRRGTASRPPTAVRSAASTFLR